VTFKLTPPAEAVEQADLVVFLVKHKAFAGLEIKGSVLDFCGIGVGGQAGGG
jgi:UDP-N-acetyl-D-mannosaminuronic acid dehydrogenase